MQLLSDMLFLCTFLHNTMACGCCFLIAETQVVLLISVACFSSRSWEVMIFRVLEHPHSFVPCCLVLIFFLPIIFVSWDSDISFSSFLKFLPLQCWFIFLFSKLSSDMVCW